jgi:hypothetical protein
MIIKVGIILNEQKKNKQSMPGMNISFIVIYIYNNYYRHIWIHRQHGKTVRIIHFQTENDGDSVARNINPIFSPVK